MKILFRLLIIIVGSLSLTHVALSKSFPLPAAKNDLIGKIFIAQTKAGDNLHTIARRYDMGYYEILEANRDLEGIELIPDTPVVIPQQFVLPAAQREGLVINLAEMRLYYFPKGVDIVMTMPVGIGRMGWETPLGETSIDSKQEKPTWFVPNSIRDFRADQGVDLPKSMPPGPDNPLGEYAIRLAWTTYLIHGTNDPDGVGMRSSSGCIRMYPEDIKKLFQLTFPGERVEILNEPFKLGWHQNKLYMEAHRPLQEQLINDDHAIEFKELVKEQVTQHAKYPVEVIWDDVNTVVKVQQGIPELIAHPPLPKPFAQTKLHLD